jgi:hypothetical protein
MSWYCENNPDHNDCFNECLICDIERLQQEVKAAYLVGRADERKRIQAIIYDQTEKYNRDTMANLADLIERQEGI